MTTPDISVVMSVYNGAATLRETLDSIVAQRDVSFEVIVVDDGSTDDTPAILREYDVRVIMKKNEGLTRALIDGCAAARGRYIARHDVGDVSHPLRLAMQQQMLDANDDVVFAGCATKYVGPEGEPLYVACSPGFALEPASIIDLSLPGGLRDGPTHHGSVMFRRDAYERAGGYRAAFYYGQDFDLWFRLAQIGKFQITNEVLYTARVSPDSISSTARARQRRLSPIYRASVEARARGESDAPLVAQAANVRAVRARPWHRGAGLYFIGATLLRNRDPRARRYLLRSLAAWPLAPRAWIRTLQSLLLSSQ